MKPDTQLTHAGNKFYKTSIIFYQKGKISLRHACESKSKLEPPVGVSSTPQLSSRYNRHQGVKKGKYLTLIILKAAQYHPSMGLGTFRVLDHKDSLSLLIL